MPWTRPILEGSIESALARLEPATLESLERHLAESAPPPQPPTREYERLLEEEMPEGLESPLLPKPYEPIPPPRRRGKKRQSGITRVFDPLFGVVAEPYTNYKEELKNLYGTTIKEGIEEKSGRRTIFFREMRELEGKSKVDLFMKEIRERVTTSYYLRYSYRYELESVETHIRILMWLPPVGSPWITRHEEAEKWLSDREEERINREKTKPPVTKWFFKRFWNVDLKVVKDRQPLLGAGQLPDWLRNQAHGRALVTLDGCEDNLCVWRCLAVHGGANPERSTEKARILAQRFLNLESRPRDVEETSLDELEELEKRMNKGKPVAEWLGIRVYEPEQQADGEVVWHLRKSPNEKLKNVMTMGKWEGHAFLIKDIGKLAKVYECANCKQRFTKAPNLNRHHQTCVAGKTVVVCPAEKVEAPETAWERAMYQKGWVSNQALLWMESEAEKRKIHIHHAMCGHGGERWLPHDEKKASPVDGYNHEKRQVFQYHDCLFHGCPKCFPNREQKPVNEKTCEELFQATQARTEYLRKEGYEVIEAWTCEVEPQKGKPPKKKTKAYPHAIMYDFEAYGDGNGRKEPTEALTIENEHVPISVSVGDTLEKEPTHISDKDPKRLVERFMEELGRR